MTTKDPCYAISGPGPGGGPGGTHIYADLVEAMGTDSPQAQQFVLLVTLGELARLASSVRDAHPGAFKHLSQALDAGAHTLFRSFSGQGPT
jgi:hypothetical protein